MGIGIDTVFQASGKGGLKKATGKDHISGLFSVALDDGNSSNPFQTLGLGEDMIFDLADTSRLASIRDGVAEIAKRFEDLELMTFQRRADNMAIVRSSEANYTMVLHIIDLETDTSYDMELMGVENGIAVV